VLGLEAIGRGRGQHLHLLAHPVAAAASVEVGGELEVDVAQVGDVGNGVGELCLTQGPPRPIGKAVRLIEAVAGDALNELVIGDGIAIAQDHGRHLGINNRGWNDPGLVPAYFDVLTGGMEDLDDVLVRHQCKEGGEIDALGQRVDDDRLIGARHLCDAEPWIIRALAQKLGVYGHEGMVRHARTGVREAGGGRNRLHGR
jgi:hypothetical protein